MNSDAHPEIPKEAALISADKGFEIEAKLIGDEITRRMDYNRRVQNFQVTTIGVCFAALIGKGSANIDNFLVNALCVIVAVVNTMFLLEIRQNTYYQRIAALYVKDIINKKYTLSNKSEILEWESFLHDHWTQSGYLLNRLAFVGSAHLLMSIYLTIFPVVIYSFEICEGYIGRASVIEIPLLIAFSFFNIIMIYKYIKSGPALDTNKHFDGMLFYRTAKEEEFEYFYNLRKETMHQHFKHAGMSWNDSEIDTHRKSFDPQTLRMIYLNNARVGFINVKTTTTHVAVSHFCIEPTSQNSGIGTAVMRRIIDEAARHNKPVCLDVLKGNRAVRLYKRLGFVSEPGDNRLLTYLRLEPNTWQKWRGRLSGFWQTSVLVIDHGT